MWAFVSSKRKKKGKRTRRHAATDRQSVRRSANSESVSCSNRAASALCAANAIRVNLKESKDSVRILFLTVGSEIGGRRGEKPYLLCAKLIIEVLKVSLSANLYTLLF